MPALTSILSSDGSAVYNGLGLTSPTATLHIRGLTGTKWDWSTDTTSNVTLVPVSAGRWSFNLSAPAANDALFDFSPIPTNGTGKGAVRFFRDTNTTGLARLEIMQGNGTGNANSVLGGNSDSYFNTLNGNVLIGTATNPSNYKLLVSNGSFSAYDTTNGGIQVGAAIGLTKLYSGTNQLQIANANNSNLLMSIKNNGNVVIPILTASNIVATDASKNLVSVATSGTGSVVLSASPTLTGVPLAPTATAGTNTTQVATTAFVTGAVFDGLASKANNTLGGIVAALGFTPENVANKATTLTASGTAYPNNDAVIAGLATKEPSFAKNTAFNKDFGTTSGTVAEGNDSRILNGQTAFSWGNHASAGYALTTGSNINQSSFRTALGLGSNAYTSTAFLPLMGGTLDGALLISSGYGIGFKLEDGFSITREAGYTSFKYGNIEKMKLSGNGLDVIGNITASPAIASNQVVVKSQLDAVARPYKVYTALLSQTGTNAPTATVLENTLGGPVVWSRTNNGVYDGTLTGAFASNKTTIQITGTVFNAFFAGFRKDDNTVTIGSSNTTGIGADNLILNSTIEIRVYN